MAAVEQSLQALASIDIAAIQQDDIGRYKLMAAMKRLQTQLESPWDVAMRILWIEPPTLSLFKIALDIKLFSKFEGTYQGIEKLAQATNTNAELLHRCLRFLAAIGVIDQNLETKDFGPTRLSDAFAKDERLGCAILHTLNIHHPVYTRLPEYLKTTSYAVPSGSQGPFQYAMEDDRPYFEWLKTHPEHEKNFHSVMAGYTSQRPRWTRLVPADYLQDLVKSADKDGAVLVDIGGGLGSDIEAFRQVAQVERGLVLQDQPNVIEQVNQKKLHPAIETMAYDFFTPQPVRGAKAYYMHSVLHDWPDEKVVEILKRVAAAMTPGYSRLLLNESVLRDVENHPLSVSADLLMMTVFCARERTERDWEVLIQTAGLKVKKIWWISEIPEGLIEAEKVEE